MKIALGTVQFGMQYGVANTQGRVSEKSTHDILRTAKELNINTLDTALAYGTSEKILGHADVTKFDVISKVPPNTRDIMTPASWVNICVNKSLNCLKIDSLAGLLLHRPLELLQPNGDELYEALVNLKRKNLVKKIGVSVYEPEDLVKLAGFDFDLVQLPLNILDRRFINAGWLEKLSKESVEIHTRSAFLQGLLLMPASKRPKYFKPWRKLLSEYDHWVANQKISPLQACLGHLNSYSEIDKIVVGVDTPEQLRYIVKAAEELPISVPKSIQTHDINLINPGLWNL